MAIKRSNIFHFKTPQNLPKSGFLVGKYAIWQPRVPAQEMRRLDQLFWPMSERLGT
jgi:hypothetical protein